MANFFFTAVSATCVVLAIYWSYQLLRLSRRDPRMPPGNFRPSTALSGRLSLITLLKATLGPPTIPIIGNEHLIPKANAHFMSVLSLSIITQ